MTVEEACSQRGYKSAFSFCRLTLFALAVLAFAPTLITPIPAMSDYPNHLARMFLLMREAGGDHHPFYKAAWAIYPNLAMDIIVPYVAKFTGAETALRLFLLVSQLLVVTGAIAIERVVKGKTIIAPFAALMFLYSLPFALGFLNFEFGIGIALWGIAAMIRYRDAPLATRLAVHSVFCVVLFMAHLFAFGVYGAALGFHELWRISAKAQTIRIIIERIATLASPALVLFSIMIIFGGAVGGGGNEWNFDLKLGWLFAILNAYSPLVSIVSFSILAGFLVIAARLRVLHFEGAGRWIGWGFAVLYFVIPWKLLDTAFADLRIIPAAALIAPAFMSFSSQRWQAAAAALASLIIAANVSLTAFYWYTYNVEYKAVIASFSRIEKSSRILIGWTGESGYNYKIWDLPEFALFHAPTLATYYADAFVPSFFTGKGKQPIVARENVQELDVPYGMPAPLTLLPVFAGDVDLPPALDNIENWPKRYDYLYIVGAPQPNPMPDILAEIDRSERFVLYRIRKQASS